MENLDDNSGWKVIGDGGDEGWKLIDDKGNIEWKIENINGEWKVTSADELPTVDNSTATEVEAANATTDATNTTSEEATATTPAPSGGWDDDKQGRYIVWKFSEDGKGEARVYGGRGTEPEVWSVGDNNQYWKETMGIKSNGNNAQNANNGWSADGTAWQNDGGWQNSYQPGSGSWQTTGTTTPQQNNGWNNGAAGVSPQGKGPGWQSGGPTAPASNGWKNGANGAPKPENNRGWQTGNAAHQGGGNGWQQKAPAAPQTTTWSNVGSTPQHAGGWQNQQPQAAGAWNNGGAAPQTAGGWQNTAPVNQPVNGGWKDTGTVTQAGWQNGNGAVAPQSGGGWAPGTNGRKGRTKGRWRNPGARARNTNGWQPNKQANGKKNVARNPWNSRNRASSWAQEMGEQQLQLGTTVQLQV
ncbi:uncharacterized protein CEXT_713481 [Caerostris extrusa]|uniref:Uncharacterized protein n=1 Tax=Caerostris extrusa TaxID=172846 RepID=A0AAV4QYD1_CAEEX|nr:uncharacterized protein CEXT_713481 [Caerostris extrusa]